jgi:hypothetical protein
VTAPLVFLCVLLADTAMSATGNTMVSVAGGSVLSLARIAPWLLAGTAVSLTIGWTRGLPRCVAQLRRDLRSPAANAFQATPVTAVTRRRGNPHA